MINFSVGLLFRPVLRWIGIGAIFLFLTDSANSQKLEYFPEGKDGQLLSRISYSLQYSERDEQPFWVAYWLTPAMINGIAEREDKFKADPLIVSGSAQLSDYKASGYDRGHLAPAADMKLNSEVMAESFYLSNMSPQVPAFNRGIWSQAEDWVREYVERHDSVYVVTGPVFNDNKGSIGANAVTVPGYYYKIIYDPFPNPVMLAFVIPNEKAVKELQQYRVSVDYIEAITGLNFFSALPDSLEVNLERIIEIPGD